MNLQNEYLVFQYRGVLTLHDIKVPRELEWKRITPEDLDVFFHDDPQRQTVFQEFLRKGYVGFLLHQQGQWVSYGWMSTPNSPQPPHLPRFIRKYRCFWLFYAHTREEYRGRGYQKLTLRLRIHHAMSNGEEIGPIFVDIENWNLPSYRALQSLKFSPNGVMHTRKWGIPRVWTFRRGKWKTTERHNLQFSLETARELAPTKLIPEERIAVAPLPEIQLFESEVRVKPQDIIQQGPLFIEGWQEYNKIKWGLDPVRVRFEEDKEDPPAIDAIFYLNHKGKLRLPPGNAYMPLSFQNAPNTRYDRTYRQWVTLAGRLAEEMGERGLAGAIALPPGLLDARPWQWAGFKVGVKYTFLSETPYSLMRVDAAIRNRARKAEKHGYTCERTTNFADVFACLESTAERQMFHNYLSVADMKLARELIGDDQFRAYVCYSTSGEPVSAQIRLHAPGHKALGLVAGTKGDHLHFGVNQLLTDFAMVDMENSGATGFDFAGANIKRVALAKVDWGAKMVPYYTIEPYDLKSFAKWARQGWEASRNRNKED